MALFTAALEALYRYDYMIKKTFKIDKINGFSSYFEVAVLVVPFVPFLPSRPFTWASNASKRLLGAF